MIKNVNVNVCVLCAMNKKGKHCSLYLQIVNSKIAKARG